MAEALLDAVPAATRADAELALEITANDHRSALKLLEGRESVRAIAAALEDAPGMSSIRRIAFLRWKAGKGFGFGLEKGEKEDGIRLNEEGWLVG
eukprot:112340-Amorphochlora_amoeboformis.AAC.1